MTGAIAISMTGPHSEDRPIWQVRAGMQTITRGSAPRQAASRHRSTMPLEMQVTDPTTW